MRLTRIYTKIGDQGTTMLASGEKVSKSAQRIEAYGTVDELNSWVGFLRDQVRIEEAFANHWLDGSLARIQNQLFDLGSELATPTEHLKPERQALIATHDIETLEREMDLCQETLPPLANFVLPGGHSSNSLAHLARTVCRRAEREVVRLRQEEPAVRLETQIFLNRLSDWFFVISRLLSQKLKCPEVLWQQRKPIAPPQA